MKTGVKKYDKLSGRIGWQDVDYMRFLFVYHKKCYEKVKKELNRLVAIQELSEGEKK